MALRRSRATAPATLRVPTWLSAEGTVTCRARRDVVWPLLEDPASPLHQTDGVERVARLAGVAGGVGEVQVSIRLDEATGRRYVSVLEVTEHSPGRYAAWRGLESHPELAGVPRGGSVKLHGWDDGSTTLTLTSWVELPAGALTSVAAEVQSNLDREMARSVEHHRKVLERY